MERLVDTDRAALAEAFDAHANTMSAVNDGEIMGKHTNGPVLNAFNVILVLVAFVLAAISLPDLINTLTSGGL